MAAKTALIPVVYRCIECATLKIKYQPVPTELHNKDFRQFCWQCKAIVQHTRHF